MPLIETKAMARKIETIQKEIKKLESEYYKGKRAYSDYIRNRHELTMEIYQLTARTRAYCNVCGQCKNICCEHFPKEG